MSHSSPGSRPRPGAVAKPLAAAPRACLALAASFACAAPAHANTGNIMPMLMSFFVAIPALLLVPAIAIACSRQDWKRKLPWVIAALAVAILSFGSLWWATQTYSLMANSDWYRVYLWALPPYVLWPIARSRLQD